MSGLHYWLVFHNDQGNREDCNLFYTDLIYCETKEEAISIAALINDTSTDKLYAIKKKLYTREYTSHAMEEYGYIPNSDDSHSDSMDCS